MKVSWSSLVGGIWRGLRLFARSPQLAINQLTFGGGSPTSRLHIRPGQSPTTAADGIRFGDDVVLYRSSASTLALTGNLVVSGQITGTGAPLSLSSNNIWTGTNQFTQPVQFSNTVSVPDTGLTFTAPGAAVTRTALGLVPGTDLQAYDADLQTLAGLAKTDGNLIVADGTTWTVENGATLRATLGLGTASNVTFNQLTSTTSIVAATGSLSGQLSLPGATQSAGALLLGTTTELYESPAGTLRTPDNLRVDGTTQLGTDGTTPTTVTGQLRLGSGDVTLERSDAGELTLDGDLVLTGNLDLGGTLGVGSGGTGLDLSGMAANRFLYTSGVGVLDTSPVTAAGRALLDDPDTPTMLTTLGAQAADTDLTALGGLAKTKGNLIGANGTTWLTVPVGADGQYLIAVSIPEMDFRPGFLMVSIIGFLQKRCFTAGVVCLVCGSNRAWRLRKVFTKPSQ